MTKQRKFAHARQAGGPAKQNLARVMSYKRLFDGTGAKADAEIVLSDLADFFGYYRRPTYAQWLRDRQAPAGFELHSALCNARAEVVQYILDKLHLDDDALIALERSARLEGR